MIPHRLAPLRRGGHVALGIGGIEAWASLHRESAGAAHASSVLNVRRIAAASRELGIHTLTLYALPPRLWDHSPARLTEALAAWTAWLRAEATALRACGTRLTVIGRRDRLPSRLHATIRRAEVLTAPGRRARLRLAIDYSARRAFERARSLLERGGPGCTFDEALAQAIHDVEPTRPVDLVVLTGGEEEPDDALFWEFAYAPVVRTGTLWPDFDPATLRAILGRTLASDTPSVRGRDPAPLAMGAPAP
ncbi:MAG: undecaprenyl diphosphate synthase family protein [Gemmatimonadota bacterium]